MTTPKATLQKGRRDTTMTLTPTGREPIEFRAKDTAGLIELLAKHILETAALTPLAPEVPPGNERARAVTLATWALDRAGADPDDDLAVIARQFLREIERAATRTPEPPDSGDGAAPDIFDRLMELWQQPWSEAGFGEAQMLIARLRRVIETLPEPTYLASDD